MANIGCVDRLNIDFWQDRNVFVTGCTGFLGSWLTKTLILLKANVVGLVRDISGKSFLISSGDLNNITVVRGSVEDYFLLERIINEYEIQSVFHLAAQAIVGTANRGCLSTFETNIKGTWNILEACYRVKTVEQLIIASSDKAYGEQEELPYTEETPLQGANPYDVSKSCADLLANSYFHTYGLPVCVTRCGNFYGGGDLNFNRIIPGTIRSLIRNKVPVIRSDGMYVRDYIYIEDVVFAYLLLAEKMKEDNKIIGQSFNFSCESPITVIDLVKKIISIMGAFNIKPVVKGDAENEIIKQYLSAAKAKKSLGWVPLFSLEEGLTQTINWYKDYFKSQ